MYVRAMSKLAIVLTAAVCIPLGVVIGRPALAQMRPELQPRLTHFERAPSCSLG
jgi:hypothetical protein